MVGKLHHSPRRSLTRVDLRKKTLIQFASILSNGIFQFAFLSTTFMEWKEEIVFFIRENIF
jgi:hypothetical protein